MYKRVILLVFSILSLFSASAQVSIEKLFLTMPSDILWLDQAQRQDLFAYFKDKKINSISNNLNGYCKVVDYNEETKHLALNTSQKGSMELKVLGTESAPFVGVIFTVCAPACHSGIRFYSTDWKPIEMPFPTISASDFIAIGLSEDNQAAANRMLTPLFVRYSFEGTNKITATCSARLFPEENGQQELKPLLKSETLTLVYQDGGWKIQQ